MFKALVWIIIIWFAIGIFSPELKAKIKTDVQSWWVSAQSSADDPVPVKAESEYCQKWSC